MKSKSTNKKTLFGKIFFVYLTSLLILSFSIQAEANSIIWTSGEIEQTIAPGESRDLKITFTSNVNLNNAKLWVVPELQPFISLEPALFNTIKAKTPQQVTLHLFIPPNYQAGRYDGTVHLKVGSKTYPQTLKVVLNVAYSGNHPPVANAGPDQTAFVTKAVTLDGSKSSDVDGDLLTYNWSFTSLPSGSAVLLSDPSAVTPTFVVDKLGTYVVQLIVNDGKENSLPDTVTISTENSKPVANAGPDQTVYVTDMVQLDGSKSTDVDGDLLSYKWSFVSVPAGSSATLLNPSSVRPSFTADKPGTYVAQLIVNDGTVDALADTVTISTANSKPVANAGADQTVYVSDTVTLDGTKSTDVDGDPLTFWWSFTSTPPGSEATLSDPAATSTTFVVDLPGIYVAQLIVNDGTVDSAPKTVTITTANSRPVASAGPDQTVFVGDMVQLDGSDSRDVDKDALGFFWSIISKPDQSTSALDPSSIINPTFVPDLSGLYVAQLIVNDGTVDSDPDTTTITANLRMVTVPNVVNMTQTAAQAAIIGTKLKVGTITQANSATVPAGSVISQNPLAGTSVAEGSSVSLVISSGPVMVAVPDVVTMSQDAAQTAIVGARLTVGVVSQASSGTVPAGNVISQTPLAGSSVPEGWLVDLVISLGDGTAIIGPEGGVVEVANPGNPLYGFRLEIPPGALSQPVTITASSTPCESIDPILAARQLATHEKKCLSAFTANPNGLVFNSPATVRLPVPPLFPRWIPLQIEFDLDHQTYWIVPGEIVYFGQENVIEMKVGHFSGIAALQARSYAAQGDNANCGTCEGYNNPSNPECKSDYWGMPSCCRVNRELQETCFPGGCDCCQDKEIVQTIAQADFSSGDCQLVGSAITTEFPKCDNPSLRGPFPDNMGEQTPECKDMNLTIDIVSDGNISSIYRCDQITLRAVLSGTSQDGRFLFTGAAFPASFEIASGGVSPGPPAGFNGQVFYGTQSGPALIKAKPVGAKGNDLIGVFSLTVEDKPPVKIDGSEEVILIRGDTIDLHALCGSNECPGGVLWRPDVNYLGVISLTPLADGKVRVGGLGPGTTKVFAESKCADSDSITVIVKEPPPTGGYIIMWNATMSRDYTTRDYIGGQAYREQHYVLSASWIGEASYDGSHQIQSFMSEGTFNTETVDRTVFPECGREALYINVRQSTITGPGLLPNQLFVFKGGDSQGSFIKDPFIGINPGGYFNVPSSVFFTIDVTGYSGCGDNYGPLYTDIDNSWNENTFYFETVPGLLRPYSATIFKKSNTVTYSDTNSDTKTVTWDVAVIINP